jgi:hypothetical protein
MHWGIFHRIYCHYVACLEREKTVKFGHACINQVLAELLLV